jgi:tRNA dimethylallyltransferase
MKSQRPLLAVVGPTGSGKTGLALELAESFGGEIVNADAYALYRGLDIGTAKPDAAERARVPHHLIDVADPDDTVTLARYLDMAHAALDDIWERGRLPVLAGGSGQYVWALIEGWQVPRVPPDLAFRAELEAVAAEGGAEALHARLTALDAEAASRLDARNTRRVMRAIEVVSRTGLPLAACQARAPIDADVRVLGLRWPREELYRRVDERVESMFAAGLVAEVEGLRAAGYGNTSPVRGGIGYKEVSAYLDGEITLGEAVERTKSATHRLVRRQGAWFREDDPRIEWLAADEARDVAWSLLQVWRDGL